MCSIMAATLAWNTFGRGAQGRPKSGPAIRADAAKLLKLARKPSEKPRLRSFLVCPDGAMVGRRNRPISFEERNQLSN